MNIPKSVLLVSFVLLSLSSFSQEKTFKWWNPADADFPVINGKGWHGTEIDIYSRLPEKAENVVRTPVWNLSQQSAGLSIRFRTNSNQILVRYQVAGNLNMYHMQTTGVSGMDLYAKDNDGNWLWKNGNYTLKDTITIDFSPINKKQQTHDLGREYRLYLPLYNLVEWMEIGVQEDSRFEVLPVRPEKPVVVYGTSIAQGACASRSGMAWTNILSRKLDNPVINLGFSGNGRLEKEVIDLISEIDAKMYIIDCLPNMSRFTPDETYNRIIASVTELRKKHPDTPILLVEHAGYSDGGLNNERFEVYTELNNVLLKAYTNLLEQEYNQLYYLSNKELGLATPSFVDGTHPNDLGMMQYAEGFEKVLRNILHEPVGEFSTTKPVTQLRELNNYDWEKRHRRILKMNREAPSEICFLGNSIVHFWGGDPEAPFQRGTDSWNNIFEGYNVRNMAHGWDRIENMLWRVYHGELDGFDARQIILKIGTNNLHLNTDAEIAAGIDFLIQAIKQRQPKSDVLVLGVLPRRDNEQRVKTLNQKIVRIAGENNVGYADIGNVLMDDFGKIDESLFTDGLHPNGNGYHKLSKVLKQYLIK
ncbi:MAG TPA: SGNH/GDSL hydrolase family protein [Tangfeifania sp.]|nr:SGNH/GDSL hydrolase family protein [Tangfeifania sp.]